MGTDDGDSVAESVGRSRVTKNPEGLCVDRAYRISDREAPGALSLLLREEGRFLGLSSGINVAGAVRLARELPAPAAPSSTILLRFPAQIPIDEALQSRVARGRRVRSRCFVRFVVIGALAKKPLFPHLPTIRPTLSCRAHGEMAEWPIASDSKSDVPQGTGGSNPSLSANIYQGFQAVYRSPFATKSWQ